MLNSRIPAGVAAVMCLFSAGCLAGESEDGVEEPLGTSSQAVISNNRLSLNRLSLNSLAMKTLSTTKLSPDGATLAETNLMSTSEGRELLVYIVECALPSGATLSGKYGYTTYTFKGRLGVAPEWVTTPLTTSGQRWMTACLLAHTNAYNIATPISLRGALPALTATQEEKEDFSIEEASFYGNIFTPEDDALSIYACAGEGIQTVCSTEDYDEDEKHLPRRSCDPDEECKLNVPGACYDITPAAVDACATVMADGYTSCHSIAKPRPGQWSAPEADYTEVITVFLRPDDFEEFYEDCDLSLGISLGLGGIGIGLGLGIGL
jgi:hypothetical protein